MYNFCVLCNNYKQVEETTSFFSDYEFIIMRGNSPIKSFLKNVRENIDFNCNNIVIFHIDDYMNIDEMDSPVYEYIFSLRFFFSTYIIQLGESEINIHPDYILGEKERIDLLFNKTILELSLEKM